MNRTSITIPILLAGFSFAALPAQDNAGYPPPTLPLVAPVPEKAAWILSIGDSKEPLPGQPAGAPKADGKNLGPVEIRVTKTDDLKRDIVSHGNGTTVESWYADGVLFTLDSNRQPMAVDYKKNQARNGNKLGDPRVSVGFTGLDWLDLEHYDRVVFYQGQPCYHYGIKVEQLAAPGGTKQPPLPTLSAEAWINVKTSLPVAYVAADRKLYTYRFLDPPPAPLTLPPSYKATLAAYERDRDKMKRLDEAAAASIRP